jgi:hypothetical protein
MRRYLTFICASPDTQSTRSNKTIQTPAWQQQQQQQQQQQFQAKILGPASFTDISLVIPPTHCMAYLRDLTGCHSNTMPHLSPNRCKLFVQERIALRPFVLRRRHHHVQHAGDPSLVFRQRGRQFFTRGVPTSAHLSKRDSVSDAGTDNAQDLRKACAKRKP